jgi:hypothetical protein
VNARAPNPLLQRTRIRAPLSRKPFGGGSEIMARARARFRVSVFNVCLLVGIHLAIQSSAQGAVLAPVFRTRCGISFSYPSDWALTTSYPKGAVCLLTLEPPDDQDVISISPGRPDEPCHLGQISLTVVALSLEKALAQHGSFSRLDGTWRYRVGTIFGGGHAETLAGQGWTGYRGASTSHYCGAAQETHDIVVGNRRRAVSISVHAEKVAVVEEILQTLRVKQ